MKTLFNTELVEVSFNPSTFEWHVSFIYNKDSSTKRLIITELEAKSIIKSFECEITCNKNVIYYTPK